MPDGTVDKARALQSRCFDFAAGVILASRKFTKSPESWILRSQVVRSATSVAANYRAACRSVSKRAFISKLSIALEEADETLLWLGLCVRVEVVERNLVLPLAREADELLRILSASRRTARSRK
jgi:four helix bundle protein